MVHTNSLGKVKCYHFGGRMNEIYNEGSKKNLIDHKDNFLNIPSNMKRIIG